MSMIRFFGGLLLAFNLAACAAPSNPDIEEAQAFFAKGEAVDFTFESGGLLMSGVFDTPAKGDAEALILFVHGYGETNIREWNAYSDLRERFNAIGIATAVWDKPGQGQSEGAFDINQSVFDSAREVVDAANHMRNVKAPGAQKIGIWGISRAGWIAPIAMSQTPEISFWISVSGTTAEDNFPYLLLSNLPHEGGSEELARQLETEWRMGCEIFRTGGQFDRYLRATETLRSNEYIKQMRGDWQTREQYEAQQESCRDGACTNVDNDLCAYVFVDDFEVQLSALDVDVLAIFGEKDLNIDWHKTRALYEASFGKNSGASLKVVAFANADHNLNISETGSIKEMQSMTAPLKADGYYEAQISWLEEHVLGAASGE